MATRGLTYFGDQGLRQVAEPVKKVSVEVRRLVEEMFETCKAEHGIGLAGPQVGVGRRVIVCDLSHLDCEPFCMINPVIKRHFGPLETEPEGCLSLPGVYLEVTRHRDVVAEGRDLKGRLFKVDATGLLARCIQHEVDHLDGKLFVDHVVARDLVQVELAALEERLTKLSAPSPSQGASAGALIG